MLASRYWTEPIRVLAETSQQLLGLQNDAISWLVNPHHNVRRRREAAKIANSIMDKLAAGPKEPVNDGDRGERNSAIEAMGDALTVVRDIAAKQAPDDRDRRSFGIRCRSAVKRIAKARQSNLPKLSTVGDPLPDALDEMLTLLADVLLASAEHQGPSLRTLQRSKSESWVGVARSFVDAAASDGYLAEREALKEALDTTNASFEIKQIGRPDMESARLLTDWWVILVPIDGNNLTENEDPVQPAFADRLAADMAGQLAFRTFVVLTAEGHLLPLHAVKLGVSQFWPADEDDLSIIASGLGTEIMPSINLQSWDSFIAELIGASREATLLRLRQRAGFDADEEVFNRRYVSARKAAEQCDPVLYTEANRMLDRVVLEPQNNERTLAGEVYRSLSHGELSNDLAAIAELRIAALSIDH